MSSRIERVVLDTNVLVSAFLSPAGAPSQVLTLVLAGELRVLVDQRILDEYAEVLARPRFGLDAADVAEVLRQVEADGERVATRPTSLRLPDADDLPFLEVALIRRRKHRQALATAPRCGSRRQKLRHPMNEVTRKTVAEPTVPGREESAPG